MFSNTRQSDGHGGKQKDRFGPDAHGIHPKYHTFLLQVLYMCKYRLSGLQRSTGFGDVSDDRVSVATIV